MILTDKTADTLVIRPQERITVANADDLRKELRAQIEAGELSLTIDLADVDIIDSKGLAVFILCHQTLMGQGGSLTVVTDNEDLRGLFRVMRLDQHFTVRGSS